jgi:hypothetical protein
MFIGGKFFLPKIENLLFVVKEDNTSLICGSFSGGRGEGNICRKKKIK